VEFLTKNLYDTTTSIVVNSNTSTAENLFNRDETFQYVSNGFNNDLTTTTITINFDVTTAVSRIGLIGMNLKDFTIFVNGATATQLSLTGAIPTSTSDFSSNSAASMFLRFDTIQASSISIDASATFVANSEKAIGFLFIGDTKIVFPRTPSAPDYKPLFVPKQIVHKISDGGTRIHDLDRKYSTKIKFKFIEESFRDNLFTVWEASDHFGFVAFGTATGWDKVLFEVVWPGPFDFYKFSANAPASGFSGSISLAEVSL